MNLEIIPFDPAYTEDFKQLNIDWLEKYFYVEPRDEEVLGHPKKYIIDPGGHIFFAKMDDEIVGTIALIKTSDKVFELSKMAVVPMHQGQKIGQRLLQHSIDFAKAQNWEEIILYSNRTLENAIYLYIKYGFEEVEIEGDNPYHRGDIKMRLELG